MLDRTASPCKARLRDCRRDVLRLAGVTLLAEISPPPNDGGRFFAMQTITTLIARSTLSRSTEAAWLGHVLHELKRVPAARKSKAIGDATAAVSAGVGVATVEAAFPSVLVSDEELAVAILGVLVAAANGWLDPRALLSVRRFPPRLRALVAALVSAADGSLKADRADLLAAASIGVLDKAAFDAAGGMRDLLRRMRLPKAAARITPAGCGPISRFSAATFRRWSNDPQLLGLLDTRSLQQRRQVELCSRIASAVLAHARITAVHGDAMIRWALVAAPELPAGRFGAKYVKLVRWMTDTASPRRGLRPRRPWTPKISVEKALPAAAAHAEVLGDARKGYRPFALPADPPDADDQWPRGGGLGDGISLRRLWSLSAVESVGRALSNCLATSPLWAQRHQSGETAVFAILDGVDAIGAIAVGRDMTGALAIIESGGPFNSVLQTGVQRAIQKWLGQANANGSGGA